MGKKIVSLPPDGKDDNDAILFGEEGADYVSVLLKKDGEDDDLGIVFTCLASKQFNNFVAEARAKLVEQKKLTEHQDIQVMVGSNRAIEKPDKLMWNVRHDNNNKDGYPFLLASYVILGHAKPSINIVVIGHVNSGKSTTVGHLICKLGSVDKKEMDMITQEAVAAKKWSMRYAWVLDKLKAERERDHSIDLSLWKFETCNFCCTVTDAPGHRDFIKNMITGTSLADSAILVIDSTALGLNAGLSKYGQTREHALLAFTLGVNQMICCCNKIDATTPAYSMVRYDEIVMEVSLFLKKVGYKLDKIPFIPMSGLEGDNMIERSANLDWYKGPTLLEAIDSIQEPKRPFDKPLRVPIQQTYRIGGIGCVTVGRVQSGILKPGMDMTFGPTSLTAVVRSVNDHPQLFYEAGPGEEVAFNLKKTDSSNLKRGDVGSNAEDDPVKAATSFVSQVIVTGHPGLVHPGYTPVMSCHMSSTSVKFAELLTRVDRRSGVELEKEPKFLKKGDAGMVKMIPTKPVVVETFSAYPPLGRFALRDMRQTVAIGVIKSVEK